MAFMETGPFGDGAVSFQMNRRGMFTRFCWDTGLLESLQEILARGSMRVDAEGRSRGAIEILPDGEQFGGREPLRPADCEPARKAERLGEIIGGVVIRLGEKAGGEQAEAAIGQGHAVGRRHCEHRVGEGGGDFAEDGIEDATPAGIDFLRESDGLMDGGVVSHTGEKSELVGAKAHERPKPLFDAVPRTINVRGDQGIERGLPADRAERQFRGQGSLASRGLRTSGIKAIAGEGG